LPTIILKDENISLISLYPKIENDNEENGKFKNIKYYGFLNKDVGKATEALISKFKEILIEEKPDVIHIWGTEYSHTLAMVQAANITGMKRKVVISIQGLISIYSRHYLLGIPENIIFKKNSLRDIIRSRNLAKDKKNFSIRSTNEIRAIENAYSIIGRTEWDRACVSQINKNATYYHCDEVLRQSFYHNRWEMEKCEKGRIFISQGDYAIKGLHIFIEALAIAIKEIEFIKVYIAGRIPFFKFKSLNSPYGNYILSLIEKYSLKDKLHFIGPVNEKEIIKQYLKSNLFISPSTIENSSNSICEAMILGVPIIASFVGGNPSIIENKKEGILYQADAPYMLAYYITYLIQNKEYANAIGCAARERALKRHDPERIYLNLMSIYKDIKTR